jgi:hypothetical protein
MKKPLVVLWFILMISIEAYYLPKIGVDRRALVGFSIAMLTAAFPSSVLVVLCGILLAKLFGDYAPRGPIIDFLTWQVFVVVGYFQWFVWLPKFINKLKRKKSPVMWGLSIAVVLLAFYWLYRLLCPMRSIGGCFGYC